MVDVPEFDLDIAYNDVPIREVIKGFGNPGLTVGSLQPVALVAKRLFKEFFKF